MVSDLLSGVLHTDQTLQVKTHLLNWQKEVAKSIV